MPAGAETQEKDPTQEPPASSEAEQEKALIELNQWEDRTRGATNFAAIPPFEKQSGENPFTIVAVSASRAVGVLRGSSQLVVLDGAGRELSRIAGPDGTVGVAVVGSEIVAVGTRSHEIARYAFSPDNPDTLIRKQGFATGYRSLRAIAARSTKDVVVVDEVTGTIVAVNLEKKRATPMGTCHGPLSLEQTKSVTLVACASDHQVRIFRAGRWLTPISHSGPVWAMDAIEHSDGSIVLAIAGIEDRPLDRSDQGSFGYIDSFVFVYRIAGRDSGAPKRLAAINVGERGLITPKWIELRDLGTPGTPGTPGTQVAIETAGYGSPDLLTLEWESSAFESTPSTKKTPLPPGTTARARIGNATLYANPLLDCWLDTEGNRVETAGRPSDGRSVESRLGELLFFTHLMAPWSSSQDRKSSFTCEACHFEGYVDGRIHFTGRDDVSATSRPLRGLFNNAPHFSRALDETTTEMVNNEFRVANKLSGKSPWFALKKDEFPWLARAGFDVPDVMSAKLLRRSLMTFLRDFTHAENPTVLGRTAFDATEKAGAEIFRDRCEECHRSHMVASNEATRVPFEAWATNIFTHSGSIVWGRMSYEKTGVKPYVHEKGARPPTLRRLYRKWPYFTNGTAKSLADVLDGVRIAADIKDFSHAGDSTANGKPLSAKQKKALLAFLALL